MLRPVPVLTALWDLLSWSPPSASAVVQFQGVKLDFVKDFFGIMSKCSGLIQLLIMTDSVTKQNGCCQYDEQI
ncbi:hypothetical protein EWB00_006458 [Schistosoma japonicum]|uniref:Secreted protein n=1 Tax=Schistosoma japonicum TaxID=6182 RepID=A0A4Z2CYS2_SCHJA|nr:hypothetical protein KSF78_0004214 [Schistosoma japonicum]TNN09268.1 hypothetical protein EWB00_006458 [Schistosoma japonicum]